MLALVISGKRRTSLELMADIFDVLSDETRRTILQLLLESSSSASPEVSVSTIVGETGLSQPSVSKQLKVLREAGLVSVREVGQHRLYRLDVAPLRDAGAWLDLFRAERSRRDPVSLSSGARTASSLPAVVVNLARDLGAAAADLAGKAPWR
jgi:DNA-binding transcriptional ArsR family regulator